MLEGFSTDLDADAPTLPVHFSRAGDSQRTWQYALLAGELARRSYANADAADHFEAALERAVACRASPSRPGRLWESLGDLRELAGMFEASVDAYRRAASSRTTR